MLTTGMLDPEWESSLDEVLATLELPARRFQAQLGSGRAAEVIDVGVNGVRVTLMLMESIRAERSPDRRGQRAIAIHGGRSENLGSQRSWSLGPFTWEIRNASISPSVGRSVVPSHDQPRQCEGVPGIQPWTARTATLVLFRALNASASAGRGRDCVFHT